MKNQLLFVAGLLLSSSLVSAPMAYADDAGMEQPNAVSFELLGRGLLWSINYDRSLSESFGVGIGFSHWSVGATSSDGTDYAAASVTIIPLYLDWYFAETGRNRFYLTGGADIINASFNFDGLDASGSGLALTAGVGYEYRAANGFLFRVTPYFLFGSGSTAGWLGLSFGYAF